LNGVELPCGSLLSVQPADFDYKNKKNVSKKNNSNGQDESKFQQKPTIKEENGTNSEPHPSGEEIDDKLEDEDDLDDFFSSL